MMQADILFQKIKVRYEKFWYESLEISKISAMQNQKSAWLAGCCNLFLTAIDLNCAYALG